MKVRLMLIVTILGLFVPEFSSAQVNKTIKEYLAVPGPIILNKTTFKLVWTSHPSDNYYKQEYIPSQDNIENYKKMISLELLVGDATTEDLAKAKMEELKQLKLSNPIINYEVFKKSGEILLDFLISQNSADGKLVNIIERNVYRYKPFTGKDGKKAVILFAGSERAYGDEIDSFLLSLKTNKSTLLNAVAGFSVPQVSVKD